MAKTTYEMWTHGTSLHVQDPSVCKFVPRGWGMDVEGEFKKGTWVQLAVPTPVVAAGVRLRVSQAMLRFRTDCARVVRLHVWDGATRIAAHDDLHLEGSWQDAKVGVAGHRVHHGVTVSVYLGFWDPMSDAEIQAHLTTPEGKKAPSWEGKEKELQGWREWGFPVPGTVQIAGAGCVFEKAIPMQVDLAGPMSPVPDIHKKG